LEDLKREHEDMKWRYRKICKIVASLDAPAEERGHGSPGRRPERA
jgi:hypothetical protein